MVLSARFGGYDALADPVGWLIVLLGLRGLPELHRKPSAAAVPVIGRCLTPSTVHVPVVVSKNTQQELAVSATPSRMMSEMMPSTQGLPPAGLRLQP